MTKKKRKKNNIWTRKYLENEDHMANNLTSENSNTEKQKIIIIVANSKTKILKQRTK